MKVVAFAVLFALLATSIIAHGDHDHEEEEAKGENFQNVVKLTSADFDEAIAKNEMTMVKFFAPWCGHCKRLAPFYAEAATTLLGKAVLAEVDCTTDQELCSKYGVQGFPTVKLFRSNSQEPAEYEGERKTDAIVSFILKQKQPAYVEASTKAMVDEFVTAHEMPIVGLVGGNKEAETAFISLAKALRNDMDFAMSTSEDVAKEENVKTPTLLMFRKFDEPRVAYEGEFTVEALKEFVTANSFPVFGSIGPENYQKYVQRGVNLAWVFVDYEKNKDAMEAIGAAAKEFKGKLSFVHLDGVKWAEHAKTFGLGSQLPGIVIEDREAGQRFIYPATDAITVESLKTWAQNFLDKKLTPNMKSQPIPEKQEDAVTVVVGKSFESVVLDKTKDVFVKFYAPWCGHCKELAPKWLAMAEQVAKTAGMENVIIAQVDATENDVPHAIQTQIRGFPTLMFFPANDKENPILFQGGKRDTESLFAFVKEKSSTIPADKKDSIPAATEPKHEEL
eukprot:TRINITY_DN17_c0_g1_i1.p1 TRINITY_DN17_c0_g1~~TRINITY_DN17_c0_g1_i1.p1  ORF type:complete len:505 (+),score=138.93 TRINITY_DN17_c0_g1_i1:45-1559(+)